MCQMCQGISFHSVALKWEKDSLYNSRSELLTKKIPEADALEMKWNDFIFHIEVIQHVYLVVTVYTWEEDPRKLLQSSLPFKNTSS